MVTDEDKKVIVDIAKKLNVLAVSTSKYPLVEGLDWYPIFIGTEHKNSRSVVDSFTENLPTVLRDKFSVEACPISTVWDSSNVLYRNGDL